MQCSMQPDPAPAMRRISGEREGGLMRFRTAVAVTLLAVACAGCASIRANLAAWGDSYAEWREAFWRDAFEDPARVDRIVPGTMTRQQVRQLLGDPHAQTTFAGEETWTYKSYRTLPKAYVPLTNAKSGTMQSLVVSIVFTGEGVVKKLDTEKQQW